jgi:hypothetical protein
MVVALPPAPEKIESRRLADLPPVPTLRQAVLLLARLARDPTFLDAHVHPLIEATRSAEDWHVAQSHEARDGSYSLQVFVWPPGTATRIHDHACWGAYRCVVGSVLEERYERLDDGSRPEYARLKKVWQLWWSPEDGASTTAARGRGHPPGREPGREPGDLGPPLRTADRGGGRPGLRPLQRLGLRPAGFSFDSDQK